MFTPPEYFIFSFLIGLTGALAPGPTLIATIRSSVDRGWTAGPMVTAGHAAIETIPALLIIFGLSAVFSSYTSYIAVFGGVALVLFGILSIKPVITPFKSDNNTGKLFRNPFTAGVITSASNPYFWLWWLTIGSGFLLDGIRGGVIMAVAFMAGHWMSDFLWFTFVSTGVSRGKKIMPEKFYGKINAVCGGFLVIFGIYYIYSVTGFT
ncbi:threonine/homoserine/homoserine lactone efflux protein [Methanomicrobium sp. W14]|uniref:LysE family transporter n=1 Tax=Methanomicrobium sp. W14 TaxID=2817839 RepID=UPI001AE6D82D|nr:LysE family transporter [Methanomicrobium sp. W14]MBP2134099.1 threonine/homoserine/homoserine lactone efflux protein [Methanomicrobium sp. W14]